MRTFHIGGTAARSVSNTDIVVKSSGRVKLVKMKVVVNDSGEHVVLDRNGKVQIVDSRDREMEVFSIPSGAFLRVEDGQMVESGAVLCNWDPHNVPIFSGVPGRVRYDDIVEGETFRFEKNTAGNTRRVILEHRGDHHPQIMIEKIDDNGSTVCDSAGKPIIMDFYSMPDKAYLEVEDDAIISAGTILAKTPPKLSGTQDITGGLPRVTEIFEARKPKEPAVIADIDGVIELKGEKRRGKREAIISSEEMEGVQTSHLIPPGKHLLVRTGDRVVAGDALVEGPQNPHDILRILDEEAVQKYLVDEVQKVYRAQRVSINDKHIEIIVSQMLRKVLVEHGGDTGLLEGALIDKFEFKTANDGLAGCLKIEDPGDTSFLEGDLVPREKLERENLNMEMEGKKMAKFVKPEPARGKTQLLGITKAAVQSFSFLSSASFQETTKVLTEAALAGKVDNLVGLKENVILGHMIPAGTGFKLYQNSEFGISKEALLEMHNRPQTIQQDSFSLLDDEPLNMGDIPSSEPSEPAMGSVDVSGALDDLLGGAPKPAQGQADDDDLDIHEEFVTELDKDSMIQDGSQDE